MEYRKETLLILSPGFPVSESDTTCLPPQQLFVKSLKSLNPELHVIVLALQYPFFTASYTWHGVEVISIGGKSRSRFFRLITWFKAWKILLRLKKNYQIKGLLSFWFGECALLGHLFGKFYHIPHRSWILGQDARKGNKYFRWIRPKPEGLIALSDFVAEEIKRNYMLKPAHVIPLGINISMFNAPVETRNIDILGAGSLIPLKQYDLFIEVIKAVREYRPNLKAVICGKGPEMNALKELASSAGLGSNLIFAGEISHQEVLTVMQNARIFLHTSAYEGFGSVLSEALFAGCHVVSFCQPMKQTFKHFHAVKSKADLIRKTEVLIQETTLSHEPVLMFPIEQVVIQMMRLFFSAKV